MPKRRKFPSGKFPRSGNVIHVSRVQLLDLAMVKKLGLEDVDWEPATCCHHCIEERIVRGEVVEESAPPSGTGWQLSGIFDAEALAPSARAPRASRKRRDTRPRLRLVRPRVPDHENL